MADLNTAPATFIFFLQYVWSLRQHCSQPTPLITIHLLELLDIFNSSKFLEWCDEHKEDLQHIAHHALAAVHDIITAWAKFAHHSAIKAMFGQAQPIAIVELSRVRAVARQRIAKFTTAIDAASPSEFLHVPLTLACAAFGGLASPGLGSFVRDNLAPVIPSARPPSTATSSDHHVGFIHLTDLEVRDLPTLACDLCYRDAVVRKTCQGNCTRPHFPNLCALPPPCLQTLRSFVNTTLGGIVPETHPPGGEQKKRSPWRLPS